MTGELEMTDRPQKIIEAKLPLTWLLTSAFGVVFSLGGVYVKLDVMQAQSVEIKTKLDERNNRIDMLAQNVIIEKSRNDSQDRQLGQMQSDIAENRRNIASAPQLKKWIIK